MAIVDIGFLGYESRLANELPGGTEVDVDRCEEPGASDYGTAVAEIRKVETDPSRQAR